MSETVCPEATLETTFRPHEALVGALDSLAELGVITVESDIDVAAARLLAALDDVGACVAYDNDTYPDDRPRNPEDCCGDGIEGASLLHGIVDEVCPFLIPFIKSDPWLKDGDTYDVGGVHFTVIRGGK